MQKRIGTFWLCISLLFLFSFVDLLEMGCSKNETASDITIPVIIITQSEGAAFRESLAAGQKGDLLSSISSQSISSAFIAI